MPVYKEAKTNNWKVYYRYMQVMKTLGVRMGQEEMFKDYQKVYEETVKRQDDYNMQKDRMWKYGRAR